MGEIISRNEFIEIIKELKPKIIGLDGEDGSGKTTFSTAIEQLGLGYKVIHLDGFLNKSANGYFNYIKWDKLRVAISQTDLIIEGVMLFKIAKQLNLKFNLTGYLGNEVWQTDWIDKYGNEYENRTFEEVLNNIEKDVKRINPEYRIDNDSHFRKEIIQYTFEFRPWEKSDYIIEDIMS